MFCSHCGKELDDASKFCSGCGASLSNIQVSAPKKNDNICYICNGVEFDAVAFAIETNLFSNGGIKDRTSQIIALKNLTRGNNSGISKEMALGNECNRVITAMLSDNKLREIVMRKSAFVDIPGEVYCPKCHSLNVKIDTKGYSAVKGIVGGLLTGGIGALAGFHGRKNLVGRCLSCGHKWNIG